MRPLRSLLFVPGNRASMLDKALGLRPDAVVPDMEDSVPLAEKANARDLIVSYLPRFAEAGLAVIPRVNALSSGMLEDDIAAIVGPSVAGVSVGKIADAAQARRVADVVGRAETRSGAPFGSVEIIPWIETASAVVNAFAICSASSRIRAVAFGGEDFTSDMEIQRTASEREIELARQAVAVAARAAGVLALDTPYFDFRDDAGLRLNSVESRNRGYGGRFAIHPSQLETISAAYLPSEAEVTHARRVVAAFAEAERRGSAATSLDGKVIDVPVVERARRLLDSAGAAAP